MQITKTTILTLVVTLLIFITVAATYYNTMVVRDFLIINDIEEDSLE